MQIDTTAMFSLNALSNFRVALKMFASTENVFAKPTYTDAGIILIISRDISSKLEATINGKFESPKNKFKVSLSDQFMNQDLTYVTNNT